MPGSINTPRSALSPANFAQSLLSQDADQGLEIVTAKAQTQNPVPRKPKRARLLLDARTELTDEELKVKNDTLLFVTSCLIVAQYADRSCPIPSIAKCFET
jgi:hypothetical protein